MRKRKYKIQNILDGVFIKYIYIYIYLYLGCNYLQLVDFKWFRLSSRNFGEKI